jgi:hypothetical protein
VMELAEARGFFGLGHVVRIAGALRARPGRLKAAVRRLPARTGCEVA